MIHRTDPPMPLFAQPNRLDVPALRAALGPPAVAGHNHRAIGEGIKHLRDILEHATMHEPTRMEAQVCVDLLEKDVASALAAIGVEVPE